MQKSPLCPPLTVREKKASMKSTPVANLRLPHDSAEFKKLAFTTVHRKSLY